MKTPDTQKILYPARFEDESQEDYKTRRHLANVTTKNYLKGSYIYQHPLKGKKKPYKKEQ